MKAFNFIILILVLLPLSALLSYSPPSTTQLLCEAKAQTPLTASVSNIQSILSEIPKLQKIENWGLSIIRHNYQMNITFKNSEPLLKISLALNLYGMPTPNQVHYRESEESRLLLQFATQLKETLQTSRLPFRNIQIELPRLEQQMSEFSTQRCPKSPAHSLSTERELASFGQGLETQTVSLRNRILTWIGIIPSSPNVTLVLNERK